MFRFGRNDQKEMLGRTITELRELRVELSLLKEQLGQIIPDRDDTVRDSCLPAEGECRETNAEALAQLKDQEMEIPDSGIRHSAGQQGFSDYQPDREDQSDDRGARGEIICGEIGDGSPVVGGEPREEETAPAAEEETLTGPADCEDPAVEAGPEGPGAEGAEAGGRIEWAVVDYHRQKRPWWKLWGHQNNHARSV